MTGNLSASRWWAGKLQRELAPTMCKTAFDVGGGGGPYTTLCFSLGPVLLY